jgi:hypothetical protein
VDTRLWFHVESLWPIPRTYDGLHQNAAREFFTLACVGAQVYIAQTQPKDATGAKALRAHKTTTIPIRQ